MNDFTAMPLRPELVQSVADLGFSTPTPIQAQALPAALRGRDVLARSPTGSGKTVAFGLAALQTLDAKTRGAQVLVLTPTRELAEQVSTQLRDLARRIPDTRTATVCGGSPIGPQREALEQGAHVIVGTPGRVHDHLRRGSLVLHGLRTLVLDEADRMLDMGFIDEVRELLRHAPRERQTLLFSATLPDEIRRLSAQIQQDPASVTIAQDGAPDEIRQRVLRCERGQRRERVADLLAHYNPAAALLFCETRKDCEAMARTLHELGAECLILHGGLEQRDRDDAWLQFRNGSARILIATDVAARGLDMQALPMVLVTQLSPDPIAHVHRIGRTGRAGEEGVAISVVVSGSSEERRLAAIEEHLGGALPIEEHPPIARSLSSLKPRFRTLVLLAGKRDKLRKGDVLGALIKDAGLPADAIGTIGLAARQCTVAIDRGHIDAAVDHLRRGRVKNRKIRAIVL